MMAHHRSPARDTARHHLDFLPAALEIQQRPPAPLPRILAWIIVSMVLIVVVWLIVGQVDIVSVAPGKIIPSGQVKTIQAYERGVVKAILARDGDAVVRGQALIELDAQIPEAELGRLQTALQKNRESAQRMRLLQRAVSTGSRVPLHVGTELDADESLLLQQELLSTEWAQYQANRQLLDSTALSRQAELRTVQAEIQKLRETLPIMTRRAAAMKTMADRQLAAQTSWLELETQRISQQQDLIGQQARAEQIVAMLEEIEFRRQLLVSETAAGLLQKIEEYDRQAASLEEEVTKARAIHAQQVIVAPVDGTVQESSVHTLGAVVTPAQVLMHIVPRDVRLEVEAYLNNQDIGFVQARQQAEIKVHAFPFAEYGVIDARVSHISDDAIADEQRGWVYRMRLSMEKSAIRVNDKVIGLKPGMEVTAEIKTGQRHLIQYFLSPIIQYANESIRER